MGSVFGGTKLRRQVEGGVDQAHMSERLWKIAHEPALFGIVFFGHEAETGSDIEQPLKNRPRLLFAPHQVKAVGQPKSAGQKSALARREAIHDRRSVGVVTENKAVSFP